MAANALKKINARVKVLQKKHPNAKRKTLQKQAGREYKAGKLKVKRKPVAKKKPVKRKAVKRSIARIAKIAKPSTLGKLYKRRKRATRAKKVVRRRVSGTVGKSSMLLPVVALGGLAVLAYFMLKPATNTQVPALYQSQNVQRNQSASNILAYASAGALTISAIAKLIEALNSSDDKTVVAAGQNPAAYVNQLQAAGMLSD